MHTWFSLCRRQYINVYLQMVSHHLHNCRIWANSRSLIWSHPLCNLCSQLLKSKTSGDNAAPEVYNKLFKRIKGFCLTYVRMNSIELDFALTFSIPTHFNIWDRKLAYGESHTIPLIQKSDEPSWANLKSATLRWVFHYIDVIMSAMASQISGDSIVYSPVCSVAYHRKHQSSASQAFVMGVQRWPVNSPHQGQ